MQERKELEGPERQPGLGTPKLWRVTYHAVKGTSPRLGVLPRW